MTRHQLRQLSPYEPRQLYDLVLDVERYPEFLPWCRAARILSRSESEEGHFRAELAIGFGHVRESYISEVCGDPQALSITATMVRGPFHHLRNDWRFVSAPEGEGCLIECDIDFAFNSKMLQTLIGSLFNRATQKMVQAFTERAQALYGGDAA